MSEMRAKPNWGIWNDIEQIPLWKAVCLWADLEPDHGYCTAPAPMKTPFINDYFYIEGFTPQEFEKEAVGPGFLDPDLNNRLAICISHINSGTLPILELNLAPYPTLHFVNLKTRISQGAD